MDTTQFDLPRYLSMLPLFQDMDQAELLRLSEGSKLRRLGRGDPVFHMGDPCNEFHVAVSGQIKLFAISPAGQEKIIEIVGPGNSFGEALMFTNKPYIINAQALTDTLVLSVSKASLLREIERDTRFCMRMLAGLSRRLHGLINDVQAYSGHSGAPGVVGCVLREMPDDGDLRVVLPVSKAAIASRLSMTPEYFSRVLHELEGKGLIEIDKREIRISDPKRLSEFPLQ
jgi:CRP-like cAMP-binding protein